MTRGQPFVGTDQTPKLLRDAGLRKNLISLGWQVEDSGDLTFPTTDSIRSNALHLTMSSGEAVNAKNSVIVGESSKIIAEEIFAKGGSSR